MISPFAGNDTATYLKTIQVTISSWQKTVGVNDKTHRLSEYNSLLRTTTFRVYWQYNWMNTFTRCSLQAQLSALDLPALAVRNLRLSNPIA